MLNQNNNFIKEILQLAKDAASGKDNFEKGAVGYNRYGFVFRERVDLPKSLKLWGQSRAFEVGTARYLCAVPSSINEKIIDWYQFERSFNLRLAGSLKTLFPALKFGGEFEDQFFDVWFFAVTPSGKQFPAGFNWHHHLGIEGYNYNIVNGKKVWDTFILETVKEKKKSWPQEFLDVINFTPHDWRGVAPELKEERESFCEAFELALLKVPPSDFEGIEDFLGENDFYEVIGLKNGKPFSRFEDRIIISK